MDESLEHSHAHWAESRDSAKRLGWLKIVLAAAVLGGFLLSPKLWVSDRAYPLAPVSELLPPIPPPLDCIWFASLLILLVLIAVMPRPHALIFAFIGLAGLLSLWDQTRWQPWFYQYLLMLAACGGSVGREGPENLRSHEKALNVCRLILAATYVWSGMQKFNVSFATNVYPWLLEPLLPEPMTRLAEHSALVVPLLEIAIGLGLLSVKLRGLAVAGAVAMHVGVLLLLSPLGHNWNSIVWPWNMAMIIFVIILFWRTPDVGAGRIVVPRSVYHAVVLVLFGILPGLSFVGRWDSYLSAALYSGNTIKAWLEVDEGTYQHLPEEAQRHSSASGFGRYRIDLFDWCIDELNVPSYPARRAYRQIARSVRDAAVEPSEVRLVIRERPDWLNGKRDETVYDSDSL